MNSGLKATEFRIHPNIIHHAMDSLKELEGRKSHTNLFLCGVPPHDPAIAGSVRIPACGAPPHDPASPVRAYRKAQ
jgi:hypothetical protein